MAPEERTNNHLGSLPWIVYVCKGGWKKQGKGWLPLRERGWAGMKPWFIFSFTWLCVSEDKGAHLERSQEGLSSQGLIPYAGLHEESCDYLESGVLSSLAPALMDQQAVSRDRGGMENHARTDPLKCFLSCGHCLPETAPNLSPQRTLVQVHAACRWALHTSCGLRWNTCFWGFTPWDVRYDQDDKPSPANISPGKNTHLNFYIVSVTLAHMWIYLSFGDYIKQLVSARYYLSHGVFFCSFLFLH